jgi:hypothetical protein
VRARLAAGLAPLASALLTAKRRLRFLGSDCGGMYVRLSGPDRRGAERTLDWTLVAGSGHGPYVPSIASVVLARQLAAGKGPSAGARPCFGEFALADFAAEVADLDITCTSCWQD